MAILNIHKTLSFVRRMCLSKRRIKTVMLLLIATFVFISWSRNTESPDYKQQEAGNQNQVRDTWHPDQVRDTGNPDHSRDSDKPDQPVRDSGKLDLVHLSTKAKLEIVKGDTRLKNVASNVKPDGTLNVAVGCTVSGNHNKNERRTAVISIAVVDGMSMDMAFCIPFVVAAWQRIGWSVTVFVVGDIDFWEHSKAFNLVNKTSYEIANDVEFVTEDMTTNAMFYARFLRIFAVLSTFWLQPEDFVLISDADLIPLNQPLYDTAYTGDQVTILNSDCCGEYHWGSKTYRYMPIAQASIGMTSKMWIRVMNLNISDEDSILDYIESWLDTNNDGVQVPEGRINPVDMHMDENVVSKQIYKSNIKSKKVIRTVASNKGTAWPDNIMSYTDARLALSTYKESSWKNILQLSKALFDQCVLDKLTTFHVDIMKTMN